MDGYGGSLCSDRLCLVDIYPVMGKIYTVGFGVDIIDCLADSLLREDATESPDLSSIAVVFPGKRPQFFFKKGLS